MPEGSGVRVYTRQGSNTRRALLGPRRGGVVRPAKWLTLNDALGMIQATARVGEAGALAPG